MAVVSEKLTTNYIGRFLTDSNIIAYSTKDGDYGEEMDQSVKAKIDELQTETDKITGITTNIGSLDRRVEVVEGKVNDLSNLTDLDQTITEVKQAKTDALSAAASASQKATTAENAMSSTLNTYNSTVRIQQEVNRSLDQVDNQISQLGDKEASLSQRISNLQNTAEQLVTSLDYDGQFQVITQEAYDNLSEVDNNTIYFIYTEADKMYTIMCMSNNNDDGTSAIYDSTGAQALSKDAFEYNTNIMLKATPSESCSFINWTSFDSNNNRITINDNPLAVQVRKNSVYIANFYRNEVYAFTSWNEDGTTMYAYGTSKTLGTTDNGYTKIEVITNSVDGFVGNEYYIQSNAVVGTNLYPLYTDAGETLANIYVKLADVYSFTSWNQDLSTQYGQGTVYTIGKIQDTKAGVVVVSNSVQEEEFVGKIFYVDANTDVTGQTATELLDDNLSSTGIMVKIQK